MSAAFFIDDKSRNRLSRHVESTKWIFRSWRFNHRLDYPRCNQTTEKTRRIIGCKIHAGIPRNGIAGGELETFVCRVGANSISFLFAYFSSTPTFRCVGLRILNTCMYLEEMKIMKIEKRLDKDLVRNEGRIARTSLVIFDFWRPITLSKLSELWLEATVP